MKFEHPSSDIFIFWSWILFIDLQTEKHLVLIVNDVNDNVPTFISTPYVARIAEVSVIMQQSLETIKTWRQVLVVVSFWRKFR